MEMENGHFKKVLKANDLKRLVVTTAMLKMLPQVDPDRDIPIRVFDNQKSKVYVFKLSGRRGKYKKPVFQSRGWSEFVKDRGIAAGDELIFWAEEEEDPFHGDQYRIALNKPGRKVLNFDLNELPAMEFEEGTDQYGAAGDELIFLAQEEEDPFHGN